MKRCFAKLSLLLMLAIALPAVAQDSASQNRSGSADNLAQYEKNVTVKKLPNGLTIVLWRRPEAPVFSFFTLVDAGSAQDPLQRDRPGAHDGAHGLQGHARHRHH